MKHNIRRTVAFLAFMLCTTPAVWAQNLSGMSVYTEVPTVDDGQTSNWSSSENYSMLVDGNTSTKYGISNANPWVEFHYAQPFVPVGYNLWTANDQNGQRNPDSWVIKAKNAGDADWTTLDSVDNSDGSRLPMANDSVTRFTIQNSTAYRYFRFEATRNTGTSAFQLAELQLLYSTDQTDLQNAIIGNISSAYNYTGNAIPITFNVTASDGTALTLGTHYTATLNSSSLNSNTFSVTNIGNYTLTINGIENGEYVGTKSVDINVVPTGLAVDNDYTYGQDGYYYINMQAGSTTTLTLPDEFISSFKVYDDGGKDNEYSRYYHEDILILTAPEGYILELSGYITTDDGWAYLTVYDSNAASGTKLINRAMSATEYTRTAINTVYSSEQSMTLFFSTGMQYSADGLDLTVRLVSTNTEHDININTAIGGTVEASVSGASATQASAGDLVTLTATPESGYMLCGLEVTDANGTVAVTDMLWYSGTNTATFIMPNSAVTVTPVFTNDLTATGGLYINMPSSGTKTVTIPSGVESFKVYDDGGATGNYSNNCLSTRLVVTAPAGYGFQISGSVATRNGDSFTVFDNNTSTGPTIIGPIQGSSTINAATSTYETITFFFYSDEDGTNAGFDLTVALDRSEHDIHVDTVTGGAIAASIDGIAVNRANRGTTVTLTAAPESGYLFSGIAITDGHGVAVAATDIHWYSGTNTATFTMPGSDVSVTPTFTNELSAEGGLYINMPTSNTLTATIPADVESFKIYDDGGPSSTFSRNCDGTIVLTAPEGYIFQLSGNIISFRAETLNVYNSGDTNGFKLIDGVHGIDINIAIDTVVSSHQNMAISFSTGDDVGLAGLDLTVTVLYIDDQFMERGDTCTIYSARGWNHFCHTMNTNAPGYFTGKTVNLDADISIGRSAGIAGYEFTGIFDGHGHTIAVDIFDTITDGTAPFREIRGATIKNLVVRGSVTGKRYMAGLVGMASGGVNTIENCKVAVDLDLPVTDDHYLMGGIVGNSTTSTMNLVGCVFCGTMNSYWGGGGGLQGWSGANTLNIRDCLFAGTQSVYNFFHPIALKGSSNSHTSASNTYYTIGQNMNDIWLDDYIATKACKQARSITTKDEVEIGGLGEERASYNVSGITAYATGMKYDGTYYAGNADTVSLTLTFPAPNVEPGYNYSYTTNEGTLSGSSNPYTLAMPNTNVSIGLNLDADRSIEKALWYGISTFVHTSGDATLDVASGTALTSGTYDLYRYDEATATWQNYKATAFAMEPGHGYIYRNADDVDLGFNGSPNMAEQYSVDLTASGSGDLRGFNLVGNPYPYKVMLDRAFYSLNAEGTWQAHPDGDSIAIGQAALVHCDVDEVLTFYSATRSTNPGTKGVLSPLPKGLNLGNSNTNDAHSTNFAHLINQQIVITGEGRIQVFDIVGRPVECRQQHNIIDVSGWSKGVYILNLDDKSQKIVIR